MKEEIERIFRDHVEHRAPLQATRELTLELCDMITRALKGRIPEHFCMEEVRFGRGSYSDMMRRERRSQYDDATMQLVNDLYPMVEAFVFGDVYEHWHHGEIDTLEGFIFKRVRQVVYGAQNKSFRHALRVIRSLLRELIDEGALLNLGGVEQERLASPNPGTRPACRSDVDAAFAKPDGVLATGELREARLREEVLSFASGHRCFLQRDLVFGIAHIYEMERRGSTMTIVDLDRLELGSPDTSNALMVEVRRFLLALEMWERADLTDQEPSRREVARIFRAFLDGSPTQTSTAHPPWLTNKGKLNANGLTRVLFGDCSDWALWQRRRRRVVTRLGDLLEFVRMNQET